MKAAVKLEKLPESMFLGLWNLTKNLKQAGECLLKK
jgi:hypothetical protein